MAICHLSYVLYRTYEGSLKNHVRASETLIAPSQKAQAKANPQKKDILLSKPPSLTHSVLPFASFETEPYVRYERTSSKRNSGIVYIRCQYCIALRIPLVPKLLILV